VAALFLLVYLLEIHALYAADVAVAAACGDVAAP